MPVLEVLLDADGHVVGTSKNLATPAANGPVSARVVARPGQKLLQVTVDDQIAGLAPARLHQALVEQHIV